MVAGQTSFRLSRSPAAACGALLPPVVSSPPPLVQPAATMAAVARTTIPRRSLRTCPPSADVLLSTTMCLRSGVAGRLVPASDHPLGEEAEEPEHDDPEQRRQ